MTLSQPCPSAAALELELEQCRLDLQACQAELRQYRDLFDEAPIAYVQERLDSGFIRANRAAIEMFGIAPDDAGATVGMSLVAMEPDSQRRATEAFRSLAAGSSASEVLEMRRRDDGHRFWAHWWSRPSSDSASTKSMLLDVTDRVQMEHAKAALEFSMESGQVGEWDLDLATQTSRRSLRHDRCFGYDQPIPEAQWGAPRFLRHVHPDDRDYAERGMQDAIDREQDWDTEFRVIWPDGSIHWLIARGRLYRNADTPGRMLGIVIDVTERKRREEALRETKAALDFALQSTEVGDWDLDLELDTSRRSLRHDQCFGYDQPIPDAEWGIAAFIHHAHPDDRERIESSMREAIAALRDWSCEFRVVWPDRSIHWLTARGSIYRTSGGRATRMLGIVMDISERKHAEAALIASERLSRGQFEALTRTLDAMAAETTPDQMVEHVLYTIIAILGASSIDIWQRSDTAGLADRSFTAVARSQRPGPARSDAIDPDHMRQFWRAELDGAAPAHATWVETMPPSARRDELVTSGATCFLAVPMSIAGRTTAIMDIRFSGIRVQSDAEIALAQALANQTMLTMQLSRLSAESRRAAVIAERNRFARDIHDTLAQGFTGVIVQLQAAEDARQHGLPDAAMAHLAEAVEVARYGLREARRSVQALRPQLLDNTDLNSALRALFETVAAGTGVGVELTISGPPLVLSHPWEDHLLRIAQEALTNVIKHAGASRFGVEIAFSDHEVGVLLTDNGRGFSKSAGTKGFGLIGIGERVAAMGGDLIVASMPGSGTTLRIRLPIDAARGTIR